MASEPLIRVTGLRKTFGNHRVLDGLDLDVRAGEAVAVLGANGAGKTTLLKVLATLVRPTRGTAIVAGHDCAKDPELVRREMISPTIPPPTPPRWPACAPPPPIAPARSRRSSSSARRARAFGRSRRA